MLLAISINILIIFALYNHTSGRLSLTSHRSDAVIAYVYSVKEKEDTIGLLQKDSEPKTFSSQHLDTPPSEGDNSLTDPQTGNPVYYFKTNEVSQKPHVVVDLPSTFSLPEVAQRIAVTLYISDTGDVENVLLPTNEFDTDDRKKIMEAFKSMHFEPALIGDIAVPSQMQIEVFGVNIE